MLTNVKYQRSGVPLLIIAAAVLIVELAIVFAVGVRLTNLARTRPEGIATPAEPTVAESDEGGTFEREAEDEIDAEQPRAEPGPLPAREPVPTGAPRQHVVARGDTLYGLSMEYWTEGRLWPFAYYPNRITIDDPDLLRIGQTIEIMDLSDIPVQYARSEHDLAAAAHLSAYDAYRSAGEAFVAEGIRSRNSALVRVGRRKEEKARWVLYAASWFVPGFPDGYTDRIEQEDLRILSSYQERFGPPFANR